MSCAVLCKLIRHSVHLVTNAYSQAGGILCAMVRALQEPEARVRTGGHRGEGQGQDWRRGLHRQRSNLPGLSLTPSLHSKGINDEQVEWMSHATCLPDASMESWWHEPMFAVGTSCCRSHADNESEGSPCPSVPCVVQQYGVQGYPTIKYFNDKDQPSDYQGGRDAASMAAFVLGDWRKSQPPPEVTHCCIQVNWTKKSAYNHTK